jgi:PAS domain S-box-containing protein
MRWGERSPNDESARVLHVDDDPEFLETAAELLERESDALVVETAGSASEGLDHLEGTAVDCVVSDYDMPGRNGIEFLNDVRSEYPDLPFVLFTGKGSEEIASEAISAGVTDYLHKSSGTDQYALLANRIENAVEGYRSQRALQERKRRLETLTGNLPGIVYRSRNDSDWSMELVEGDWEALTGHPRSALGEEVSFGADVIHPEDRAEVWGRVQRALDADEPFELTYRIVTAEGTRKWVWERGRGVESGEDGPTVIEGFITDVTERKERERALEETNRQLQGVLDTVQAAIYLKDTDGRYLLANQQTREWADLDQGEEIEGMTDEELFPREAAQRFRADDERVIGTGETIEVEEELPTDGETKTLLTRKSLVRDDDGEPYAVCGVATDVTERTERARELEFFRQLVETVGVGVAVYGEDGQFQYVNDEYADLLATDRASLEGAAVWDVNPAVERERFPTYWASFEEGETRTTETTHAVDGTAVPVETVTTRQTIQDTTYHFGTITDVTERREREQELEVRSTALEASVDGVAILNSNGEYRFVNRAHAEVYGYDDPEAFVGETWRLCYGEAETERLETEVLPTLFEEGAWRGETVGRRRDGTTFPQTISLTTTEHGHIVCVVRDVTERAERERALTALHETSRRLMQAGDAAAVADIAVETARDALGMSRAAVLLWEGDSLEPAATAEAADAPPLPARVTSADGLAGDACASDGAVVTEVDPAEGGAGTTSYCAVPMGEYGVLIAAPEVDTAFDDRLDLAEILAANVQAALVRVDRETSIRAHQRKLRRQNERLEEFASIVSHDLRNPLTVLGGSLELAESTGEPRHFERCEDAVERMEALVEDLLTLAREGKTVQESESVELAALVEECWTTVDTEDATLVAETELTVEADRSRLRQLLENLLGNAVVHGGDDVTVTVGDVDGRRTDDGRGFYVADDGAGIPESEREQVFESGYTTSATGTGFGLDIVERVADAHGWSVTVTESSRGGARFEITAVETA